MHTMVQKRDCDVNGDELTSHRVYAAGGKGVGGGGGGGRLRQI